MKPVRLALVAALIACEASGASATWAAGDETPFAAFQTVCLTPNADFETVRAAASAWRDTEVTGDATLPGVVVASRLTKATKVGGVPLTLFAWSGATKAGVHVSACTVRVTKPDFDEIQGAAAAYTGFAAQDSAPKKAVFRYTRTASKPIAIDKAGFDAAAAGEGMDILTVTGDVHGSVIDLLKIKK